jgi:hypothetical protein
MSAMTPPQFYCIISGNNRKSRQHGGRDWGTSPSPGKWAL